MSQSWLSRSIDCQRDGLLRSARSIKDDPSSQAPSKHRSCVGYASSLCTRQSTFFLFAMFVTLSCMGLGALYLFDKRNNGFTINISTPAYIWQFGPTAILTICIAFWLRLGYAIRNEVPWQEMSKGFVSADKSILLDYISPFLPTVFYKAFVNRHWDVVLSITIFTLLKLTVIFSTTLFRLDKAFSPMKISELRLETSRALGLTDSNDLTARYMRSESIGVQYMSVEKGLDWPFGAAAGGAYQRPASQQDDIPANATIVTEVPAAFSAVSCEPATAVFQHTVIDDIWFIIQNDQWLNPSNDSCLGWECVSDIPRIRRTWYSSWPTALAGNDGVADRSGLDVRFQATSTSYQTNAGFIYDPNCLDPASSCATSKYPQPFFQQVHLNNSTDYNGFVMGLYTLSASNASIVDNTIRNNDTQLLEDVTVEFVSAAICQVKYKQGLGRLNAMLDSKKQWTVSSLNEVAVSDESASQSFTSGNLSTEISFAAQFTSFYQSGLTRPGMANQHEAWFTLMKLVEDTTDTSSGLTNSVGLVEPAQKILKILAPNVLASFMTFEDQDTTTAKITVVRQVLHVSTISFWAMESMLIITFIVLCILITRSWALSPELAPSCVMSSDILATKNSPALSKYLHKMAHLPKHEFKQSLRQSSYCAQLHPFYSIQIYDEPPKYDEHVPQTSPSTEIQSTTYWCLAASQKYYSASISMLAILLIGSLEIVQRFSDKNSKGFIVKSSVATEIGLLIPAAVVLTVGFLFSAGEFAAVLLGQYLLIKRRPTKLSNVDHRSIQRLLPTAIFHAFKSRQWSCALLMIAGLLAGTLTTVAAGLYSREEDLAGTNHTVLSMDAFDVQARSVPSMQAEEESKALFASLQNFAFVEVSNASFVAGLYNEFAYPSIDIQALTVNYTSTRLQDLTAKINVPALRPTLKCWSVPRDDLIVEIANRSGESISPFVTGSQTMNIFSVFTVPPGCQDLGENIGNSDPLSTYYSTTTFVVDKSGSALKYAGAIAAVQDIATGSVPGSSKVTPDFARQWPGKHQAPDCPTFAAFTVFKPEANDSAVMVNHLLCKEGVEEVNVQLTFNLSTKSLEPSSLPVVDESSATVKSGYGLSGLGASLFAYALDPATLNQQYDRTFDGFFSALIYGPDGIPIQKLVLPDQIDRLTNATQHIYRQYFAQYANQLLRARSSVSISNNTSFDNGTNEALTFMPVGTRFAARVMDKSVIRVVQNRTPKLILQIMLSIIVFCTASGYRALLEMGRLVRHNPCHLAGRLSLWAGTQVVDDVGPRSSQPSDDSNINDRKGSYGWGMICLRLFETDISRGNESTAESETTTKLPRVSFREQSFNPALRRRVIIDHEDSMSDA